MEAAECSVTLTKCCQTAENRISEDGNLRNPDNCWIVGLLRSKSCNARAACFFFSKNWC